MPGPARASRRSHWRDAAFVALDFETTGLDRQRDDVISFGTVPIDRGRIGMGGATYRLVRPRIAPSPVSVTVHGIRHQDLLTGVDADEARRALSVALRGRFLVTWYAPVENAFLAKLFADRPRERSFARRNVDVRGLVAAEGGGRDGALNLSAAAERYGVPVADPHHALDDALVTAQLFLVLATSLSARGLGRVRDLLRVGRDPRG